MAIHSLDPGAFMGKCIMRTKKLKADGNVGASLAHAFRDRETPNADTAKTPENIHLVSKTRAEALKKYRLLLPEKVRSNGVRCIEYLVTCSPDALKTPEEKSKYFNAALAWLKAKHGKTLFYAGIHVDEKTPHLYAYAVPLDAKGKLNCRSFLGGGAKLSALQDEFFETVGKPSGLERGIKGSRAKHQTLKDYYGKIQALDAAVAPPKRGLLESDEKYTERYLSQIRPLVAASAATVQVQKRNEQLEAHVKKSTEGFKEFTSMTQGMSPALIREFELVAAEMRAKAPKRTNSRSDGKTHDEGR